MRFIRNIVLLSCFFIAHISLVFSSLVAPSLRSTAVSLGGTVTVYWVPPIDTSTSFYCYDVYRSNSEAGPFIIVDSVFNYFQTSYNDIFVNANTSKYFYFLITRSDCCVLFSLPSDTLGTMKLNVTNSGNGIAYLSWNAIHTPPLPTSSSKYLIYSQYFPGSWQLIDSTPQTNYLDTTTACNEQVNYRIELKDAYGFTSVSSVDGDLFRDLIPPSVTGIDTVSVNPNTGNVTIAWNANSTKDIKGFIIYKFNGTSWDSISTVYGYNNTSYLNTTSLASGVSERYTVSTIDSCNNSTGFSVDHSTIFLKTSINKCERSIDLTWTPYFNMEGGVNSYKIFVSENAGLYQLAGTAEGGKTSFSYTTLNSNSTYCFFVQAVGNVSSRTTSSNSSCLIATVFKEPAFTFIRSASVVSNSTVKISCYVDSTAEIISFNLLRAENASGPFETVNTISYIGASQFSISDNTALTDEKSYYFQLESLDSCGNSLSKSNTAKTIFTQSIAENNFINLVTWNDYEGWADGIAYFNIYRKLSLTSPAIFLTSVAGNAHSYRDDVTDYYTSEGQFCYIVEAVEKPFNIYGFQDSVLSNESCNWQIPVTFVPNAFTPHGHNPIFYPMNVFVEVSGYTFSVYNRWGELVFESNNPKAGWDGTFKGKEISQGLYVYFIMYNDNNGSEVKRKGTVALLR